MLDAMRVGRSARRAAWVTFGVAAAAFAGMACAGSASAKYSSSAPVPAQASADISRAPAAVGPMPADPADGSYQATDADAGNLGASLAGAPTPPPTPGQPPQIATDEAPARAQPLLIYTASFNLAVFEAVAAIDAIEEMARKRGGYLVQRADNSIIVRVPAPQFHDAVSEVGALGDVLHREVTVQDVTAEFRDLELRLRNLYAVRDRVEKLLAQTKNVNEALEVERELERITTAIEQMKGRLKYLSELIAFSTIQVSFQPRPIDQVSSEVKLPFRWLEDLGLPRLLDLSSN
jgi:hypothetical protein